MTVADGSQTRLAYVPEADIGVTPANPVFQIMRYVSESMRLAKQTAIPDEIRADRNVSDIVDVGRSVEGPINTLLSYGTHDALFEALFCGAWTGNVLKNGVLAKAFTFEKTFEQGATDSFIRYRGCRINTLDIAMTTKQFITANWGVMGLGSPVPTTAIIAGATYTAPTTTPVLNAALNVADLLVNGVVQPPKVQSLSMRITNNIYANDVLGSYDADSHGLGRFEVTGNMSVLFTDLDLYNAIIGHSDLSLSVNLGAETLEKYNLSIPLFKALDGGPVVAGNGRPVVIDMSFQAKFDPTSSASMVLTRAVA